MTARNFSEDGAVGAMTGGSPADGSQVGGVTSGTLLPQGGGNSASELTSPLNDSVGGTGGGWGGGGLASDSGSSTATSSPSSIGAGGWGGGGLAAPASGKSTSYNGDWRDQINQNKDWATPWAGMTQDTGGFQTGGVSWGFSEGGAIDENAGDPNATDPQGSAMGASLQNSINQALTTVNGVLSYGRKLHGLGGGQQQAMNTDGFNQSDNVEDRRDSDPTNPNPTGMAKISQNVSDNVSKIGDKVKGLMAPDPTKNKMSQDAGINDVGGSGGAQAPAQQAIPTDEEDAQ